MSSPQTFVLSLGGSIVVPDSIDTSFVSSFRDLILEKVKEGNTFVIIVGGGKPARIYQNGLSAIGVSDIESLDWIGIAATKMNAEFLRLAFGEYAYSEIVSDPNIIPNTDKPIIIGSGWKPGWSTDYDAVIAGSGLGSKKVANLSNIDFVYDSDPRTNPTAKKFETLSWREYRDLIPKDWTPGFSAPFDPIASAYADEHGIEVAIMNGKNLENLANYLSGKSFIGTTIH